MEDYIDKVNDLLDNDYTHESLSKELDMTIQTLQSRFDSGVFTGSEKLVIDSLI